VGVGELAELAGEGDLRAVVEALGAEEDDLVLEQRGADRRDGRRVERLGQIDSAELGADVSGHAGDGQLGFGHDGMNPSQVSASRARWDGEAGADTRPGAGQRPTHGDDPGRPPVQRVRARLYSCVWLLRPLRQKKNRRDADTADLVELS